MGDLPNLATDSPLWLALATVAVNALVGALHGMDDAQHWDLVGVSVPRPPLGASTNPYRPRGRTASYHRLVTMKPWSSDVASLALAASLFRSFGDSSRLAILARLMLGEQRVVELTEHVGLAQSTVSAHLRCLLDCGLVQVRTQGRASVYSLAVANEVRAVLEAAERLLAATGDAVALCPSYGTGTVR